MKNSRENTPIMFNLNKADKEAAAHPTADEADDIFSDIDMQITEPPSADETPDAEKSTPKIRLREEDVNIAYAPGEQTIKSTAAEYAENQPSKNETAGFKAAGERVRIIAPDDPADPERVARITQLGLRAIKTIEANRERADKADKKDK